MDNEPINAYRPKLNIPEIDQKLWIAAWAAVRVERARKIIEEACKKNPSGLPF